MLTESQKCYGLLGIAALGGGAFLFSDQKVTRAMGGAAFTAALFLWFRGCGGWSSTLGPLMGAAMNPTGSGAPQQGGSLLGIPVAPQTIVRIVPGQCRDEHGNPVPGIPEPYAEVTLEHVQQALSPGGYCEGGRPYSADDARLIAAWNAQHASGLFG